MNIKSRIMKCASQRESVGTAKTLMLRWEIIEQLAEILDSIHEKSGVPRVKTFIENRVKKLEGECE